MASPTNVSYLLSSGSVLGGRSSSGPVNPSGPLDQLVPTGTIKSISKNTRNSLDPAKDPLANPNHPGQAPWDSSGIAWTHITDYSGAVFASDLGTAGTYMQPGQSGHAASQATMWPGFDIADQMWKRIGKRPLPTTWAGAGGYASGTNPPPSRFDHTWGDWIGDSADWPAGFAQPGYNPPAGAHTRASLTYRPASKAGNGKGQIMMGVTSTGPESGTTIRGSHYFDLATENFVRLAGLAPFTGDNSGSRVYDPVTDAVFGWGYESSASGSELHVTRWSDLTPTRITGLTNGPALQVDGSQIFLCGGLLVVAEQAKEYAGTQYLYAIPVAGLLNGSVKQWKKLTTSGTEFPPPKDSTASAAVQWQLCPLDGKYYAVGCTTGSKTLYSLTPPASTDADNLTGTWVFGSDVLAGESIVASAFAYNRLQWVPALKSFIFTGDDTNGPVQGIRPKGI